MTDPEPYEVTFSPAARRGLAKLSLAAATALFEHLTGPVADNPFRLGKPLDSPFDDVWSTRRGEYRARSTPSTSTSAQSLSSQSPIAATRTGHTEQFAYAIQDGECSP
jgi:mRNA interferase RelE/StbE